MFTKGTLERAKAAHHFDGIMSHNFKYSRLSGDDSGTKVTFITLHAGSYAAAGFRTTLM
jgi:hypothetical protein